MFPKNQIKYLKHIIEKNGTKYNKVNNYNGRI